MRALPAALKNPLLVLVTFYSILFAYAANSEPAPPDAPQLQQRMQALIDYIDSPEYESVSTWYEHVVLSYNLAIGRNPEVLEAALLNELHHSIGLPRSAVLSIAIRGKQNAPAWGQIRQFINRVSRSDFVPAPAIRNEAKRLLAIPKTEIRQLLNKYIKQNAVPPAADSQPKLFIKQVPLVDYNIYYGYLHAHSALSDGQGSPADAYAFARDVGQLDFFALTDHGELLLIWPWQNKWQQLVDAAQAAYLPDSFVSLWGFEWSNPFLGHLNIINSSDFTHTLSEFWLFEVYDWIAARPDAFARFNHPGDYDFLHLEFYHFLPYPPAQNQMVGIETWNGGDGFDAYFYAGGYNTPYGYLDEANQKQWYLGALGGQDNHQPDWGTKNEFRTAVLTESLTREAIVDAYRNRRFYATEDKNLELRFSANDYPMGSHVSGIMRNFLIEACDGDGDTFSEVRIYRNGSLLESRQVSGNCIREEFTYSDLSPAYYYTIVKQNDDNDSNGRQDEAVSSAIWFM